jgi:hypothetical protein
MPRAYRAPELRGHDIGLADLQARKGNLCPQKNDSSWLVFVIALVFVYREVAWQIVNDTRHFLKQRFKRASAYFSFLSDFQPHRFPLNRLRRLRVLWFGLRSRHCDDDLKLSQIKYGNRTLYHRL